MSSAPQSPWAAAGDVDVAVHEGVATLTFAHPPGNGWTPHLGRRFFDALEGLAADPEVRAIVVTGDGRDFCVGADAGGLKNVADSGTFQADAARPDYWMAMSIAKPVIAAVNGAAFGVGMQLALLCDIRFAGESTKFSTAFVRRGLIAELGMAWLLPRVIGLSDAADLLLSGRVVRADEARSLRLVNRVVPDAELVAAAQKYAAQLATSCSPASMAVIKQQLEVDLDSTLRDSVRRADALMEAALQSADFAEGVQSWREQRAPAFPGLAAEAGRFELPIDPS